MLGSVLQSGCSHAVQLGKSAQQAPARCCTGMLSANGPVVPLLLLQVKGKLQVKGELCSNNVLLTLARPVCCRSRVTCSRTSVC